MTRDEISNEYFEWLYNKMCGQRFSEHISYRKLLMYLHNVNFRYSIPRDANRAEDGKDLRWRFANEQIFVDSFEAAVGYLNGPCSVLEMMVALAIRCEENIMDNPNVGDRTGQWFWGMITNLGLGSMTDYNFDKQRVEESVERFLNREYEPNGKGGLFTVRHCDHDLRNVEIWYQLCWYLDSIT